MLKIGPLTIDPPILSAPLAGFSNYAFRQILRELGGVGMCVTEMFSARSFVHIEAKRGEHPGRLWGVRHEPRPLSVQLWDNDAELMAEVGGRLAREYGVSVVDVNFGCPVPDVAAKAESGSYLLRYPEKIGDIVRRLADACKPTPVTAKIRLGWTQDAINAIDVAQAVEEAGGAAVTVHGRTADMFYRGAANWEEIARIKPHLKQIALIGNGDLRSAEDVVTALARYDVDGVMIGRAGLAQPWIFREAAAALHGEPIPPEPTASERLDIIRKHFAFVLEQHGPEKGTRLMRSFACQFSHGLPGARAFRCNVATVCTPDEFYALLERDFPK